MAEVQKSLLKNSSSIDTIKDSINSFGASLRKANSESSSIIKQLYAGNREKRNSIFKKNQLILKRRESVRRRQQEDLVESGKVGSFYKRTGRVISSSTKGLLGRIMDFIGSVLVGWAVNNLPKITKAAQQLIERVDTVVGTLSSWFNNLTSFFGIFQSDIDTSLARVKNSSPEGETGDLDKAVDKTRSGVLKSDQQFKQMIEDLNNFNLLKALGFQPDTGDENRGDRPPSRSDAGLDSGGGFTEPDSKISGGRVSDRQVYQYLRSKGVSHIHAMGITANILGESGFNPAADEAGDGSQGIGLFQYTFPSRKQAFLRAVPDYKTNWKGQIDFAIGEGSAPQYLSTEFSSSEAAAEWWMNVWENPAADVKPGRRRKHNNWIKNFNAPKATQPAKQTVGPAPSIDTSKRYRKGDMVTSTLGSWAKITSTRGSTESFRTKSHGGIDIACDPNLFISLRVDSEVVATQRGGGYGNLIDIWVPSLGIQLRFAHNTRILISSGKIPAGTSFATTGYTGNVRPKGPNGSHIHLEADTRRGSAKYGGNTSPAPYVELIRLTKAEIEGVKSGAPQSRTGTGGPSLETIPTQSGVAGKITPERKGMTIPIPIPSGGGGGESPEMPSGGGGGGISLGSSSNSLNTFVTKTLLRELEYT